MKAENDRNTYIYWDFRKLSRKKYAFLLINKINKQENNSKFCNHAMQLIIVNLEEPTHLRCLIKQPGLKMTDYSLCI